MFLGLGHEPTPERIAYYARLLVNVPTRYIRVACDHAVVKSKSGFPPSPGEIIDQAERIHRELVVAQRLEARASDRDAAIAEATESPEEVGRLIDMALRRERA
jgi:hypothetical protein